jgi:signal recognition particle subunit SRP68
MEITRFIVSGRDQALLYGDYSTYRIQLSRRLLSIRKKLGRTTKKGAKYTNKAPVTAQDIGNNNGLVGRNLRCQASTDCSRFVHLLLLTSERAWAHAMYMKSAHSTDTKGITGSTRSHIISRLHKAVKTVKDLLSALEDRSTTGASDTDILETRAYAMSLTGAEEFEKQNWEACVKSYSIAWVIYSALAASTKSDTFKDLLSSTIEPSIRYGAYQLRIPRTVAISAITRKNFPKNDSELLSEIEKLDSRILRESSKVKTESSDSDAASKAIIWRSRTVELEDASIAVALESVSAAKKILSESLFKTSAEHSKEQAAAFDGILIASQDVVDATKHAIDELVAERVSQGDKRMQSLQITRTAVSYDMISWRIGRNRVLTGQHDGALLESSTLAKPRESKKAKAGTLEKEESAGRRLSRLRERAVLYDSTLQSLDSIRELPGVAADTGFLKEIDAKHNYFRALKYAHTSRLSCTANCHNRCLAIARSHDILSEHKNSLALLARASELSFKALIAFSSEGDTLNSTPTNITVSRSEGQFLYELLQGELQRHRALVELSNISNKSHEKANLGLGIPLVERLNTYPTEGVEFTNLVTYPPKLEPIPVKPLFFDVAWNYIDYPGRLSVKAAAPSPKASTQAEKPQEQASQQKKGWFGFGR